MKIITTMQRDGEKCFTQTKDILFLARVLRNESLMQYYISLINSSYTDDDFIRVHDNFVDFIKNCDDIINFSDYVDASINYLSNYLVTINCLSCPKNSYEKERIDHKTDAIRDMISFKRGKLDYAIPIVPDGNFEIINNEGTLVFDSSIIPDVFVLRTVDKKDVNTYSYEDFFDDCINKVYQEKYPYVQLEERQYEYKDRGRTLVLFINNKPVKKKTKIGQLLEKIPIKRH